MCLHSYVEALLVYFYPDQYFVYASNEGFGKTAHLLRLLPEPSLLAYVLIIITKISWDGNTMVYHRFR